MHEHEDKRTVALQEAAAAFVNGISNKRSLITITRTTLTERGACVTYYVSVYPEDAEGAALGFLMRKRGACKDYLKAHVPMRRVPHVEFAIDTGEKSRQRVDELLHE